MSVSCDCEGVGAAPVVTPNIGIVASTDILAADQASVDLVYALKDSDHKDLVERIETRHGLRQLSYMKEMHMGNDRYHLINIDEDDKEILDGVGIYMKNQGYEVFKAQNGLEGLKILEKEEIHLAIIDIMCRVCF